MIREVFDGVPANDDFDQPVVSKSYVMKHYPGALNAFQQQTDVSLHDVEFYVAQPGFLNDLCARPLKNPVLDLGNDRYAEIEEFYVWDVQTKSWSKERAE